ncbi:Regulatory protein, MerR [uncultured Desulfobacterium sp.]|uniref:Regulatory protein, MerR n=1 Tax=uncultured Desulfobacterium sp. TaxID=201089 RepID=A0A445N0Z6_9BACT|nr:Regulatory protein, MerR [uncultured Desulfobacterium sp.]
MKKEQKTFSLEELCTLVEMNKRKIRFYIQKGLVDRPQGTGKGAHYTHRHLEQLLGIRKWKEAGLSLERIQELLGDENKTADSSSLIPPPRPRRPGSIEVWSHLHIEDGIELHIEPQRSGLTPEQVRALCKMIIEQYEKIKKEEI